MMVAAAVVLVGVVLSIDVIVGEMVELNDFHSSWNFDTRQLYDDESMHDVIHIASQDRRLEF